MGSPAVGKRSPIEVGRIAFRTKVAIKAHVRGILNAHPRGSTIELDGTDGRFLLALLDRHPRHAEKVGPGIAEFFIRTDIPEGAGRGVGLRRKDGTAADWSPDECISPTPRRQKVFEAMRAEVDSQVAAFRAEQRGRLPDPMTCPVTGEVIAQADAHVDHQEPWTFAAIRDAFIDREGLDVEAVAIVAGQDWGVVPPRLADRELARRWREFHAAHATFRLVSRLANTSVLRRGRRRR